MACIVQRNTEGSVTKVSTRDGNRSQLFDRIAGIPLLRSVDSAVDAYMQIYTQKFKEKFGNWESKVPINRKAVNAISNTLGKLGIQDTDGIIYEASQMENPMLVSPLTVSDEMAIDGHTYYTQTLESGNIMLIDMNDYDTLEFQEETFPEGIDRNTFERDVVAESTKPGVEVTNINGDKYIVLNSDKQVQNINDIEYNPSDNNLTYSNGEPKLFFRTPSGQVYDNYGDALRNTSSGIIEAGFMAGSFQRLPGEANIVDSDIVRNGQGYILNNPSAFMGIAEFNAMSDPTTTEGYINYLIRSNILSGEMVRYNGRYYYKGQGNLPRLSMFNSVLANSDARIKLGVNRVTMDEYGRIEIADEAPDVFTLTSSNGSTTTMSRTEMGRRLREGQYMQLSQRYENMPEVALSVFLDSNDVFRQEDTEIIESAKAESSRLRKSVISLLQSLGISVVGMDQYLANYQIKHGVEPSAKALADMANNVIALAENATDEDLLEEAAHFLIETYKDQAEVTRLLDEVQGTDEWNAFAESYYAIYGKNYSGYELDNMVRKEVLGKMLKNEFARRFESLESNSLVAQIRDFFVNAINYIRSMLGNQRTELNNLISEIADKAYAEDLSFFDSSNLSTADFTLYSASSQEINDFFIRQRDKLERQLALLKKSKIGSASRLASGMDRVNREYQRLAIAMDDNSKQSTIQALISTADAQANYVSAIIDQANKRMHEGDKLVLSLTDYQNLDNIQKMMKPLMQELRGFVEDELDMDNAYKKNALQRIDETLKKIAVLEARAEAVKKSDGKKFFHKLLASIGNIPQKDVEFMENVMDNMIKDITSITSYFGMLEHSRIPVLNYLGKLISANKMHASQNTRIELKKYLGMVNNKKLGDFERLIQKDSKGNFSDFLMSDVDLPLFHENFVKAQVRAMQAVFPDQIGDKSVDDLVTLGLKDGIVITTAGGEVTFKPDRDHARTNFLNADEQAAYNKVMNEFLKNDTERRYVDDYYTMIDELYTNAATLRPEGSSTTRPISNEAKERARAFSREAYTIKKPFMNSDGRVDWYALSKDANAQQSMTELNKSKQQAKSRYDQYGNLKSKTELEIAEDLQAIDKAWSNKIKELQGNREIKYDYDGFLAELNRVKEEEGSEEAYQWLISNSNIMFTQDFYDAGESYLQKAKDALSGYRIAEEDVANVEEYINNMTELKERLSNILKANKDVVHLGDIDYDSLTVDERESVRLISMEIANNNDAIRKIFSSNGIVLEFSEISEYGINDAYKKAFLDSGKRKEWEFALDHMTDKNRKDVEIFARQIPAFISSKSKSSMSTSVYAYLRDKFNLADDTSVSDIRSQMRQLSPDGLTELVNEYARARVLPYFRRFSPKGYNELVEKLRNGTVEIDEFARDVINKTGNNDVYKYLDIQLRDLWSEEGPMFESYANKDYVEGSEYGAYQPKKSKYANKEYQARFNPDANGNATTNIEEFDTIREMVRLKREGLIAYNETPEAHNLYLIPQMSKSWLERIAPSGVSYKESLENAIRDFRMNRVDESLYGQKEGQEDADLKSEYRAIPKYFIRRLEEASDVTHDLARSYSMWMLQANSYKEKMNTIDVAMGLQQSLLNARFEGKSAKDTNAYKMLEEHVNAHYYGVKLNTKLEVNMPGVGKVDVSKVAVTMNKWFSKFNLGHNPIIALTAFTTGQFNLILEASVGQYINYESLSYATKEVTKLTSEYLAEVGDIDRNNRLYVIGEHMGIFDIGQKVQSAAYNKFIRVFGHDLPYKMLEILNFPLAPQTMIGIMDDTRLYNGMFYRFNQFKRLDENKGLNKTELKSKWRSLRKDSLYNMIEVKDGLVVYREGSNKDLMDATLETVRSEIVSLNQIADSVISQENKSSASRQYLMNFMLTHRGWFFLNYQRRIKKKGYNFQTNQMEEGTYRTGIEFIKQITKSLMTQGGMTTKFEGVKKLFAGYKQEDGQWVEMEDYEKTNAMRMMCDLAAFAIGIALMKIFAGMGDDDDNKDNWLVQFTSYIGLRTVNEMYSQLPYFIDKEAIGMLESPFVIARKLNELTTLSNYAFWEEVQSGPYKGELRLFKTMMSTSYAKSYYQLKDAPSAAKTRSFYQYQNRGVLIWGQKEKE